ncbi:MAG: Hpt domain-containing protein [Bacteroidia bacterium]
MEKVLDLTYLNEISGGDVGFVKEMLQLFVNTTALEANQFNEFVASQNWQAAGSLAHKLKAPIQMLGANELFDLVRNIEQWGKEGINTQNIPIAVTRVKELIDTLTNEINEVIPTL